MNSKINSDDQHKEYLSKIEGFLKKGFENLSIDETAILKSLSEETEKYEKLTFPMPINIDITS